MTPHQDSLNSCFSEVTGRGHIDAACFPSRHTKAAEQGCTPDGAYKTPFAPRMSPVELPSQNQSAPRLTKALLEASERMNKLYAASASPTETPAVSEQLCKPLQLLQAGAVTAACNVSHAQQPYTSQLCTPSEQQQQTDADASDTASETGSSSTPPPRKGRRRSGICRGAHNKAGVGSLQAPPRPGLRPSQPHFPWARTTTSTLVQRLLAMQGPDRCLTEAFPDLSFPRSKAARLAGARGVSPARQTSCPAVLPARTRADLVAELAADVAPLADAALMSANPANGNKAGSLPSGVAEWRVQIWPVPPNCNY